MDGTLFFRYPQLSSNAHLGTASSPILVDVRGSGTPSTQMIGRSIGAAVHHAPREKVGQLVEGNCRPAVQSSPYGGHGGDVSQGRSDDIARPLASRRHISKEIFPRGKKNGKLPTRRRKAPRQGRITNGSRANHPKNRSHWLVHGSSSRFINPDAEFYLCAAGTRSTGVAEQDRRQFRMTIKGAEFGHVGDRCSFDANRPHF